MMMQNGKVGI